MPNVMASQPNIIGGTLCENSVIPFLVARRKFWLTAAAQVPCSNAAIENARLGTQSDFAPDKIPSGARAPENV